MNELTATATPCCAADILHQQLATSDRLSGEMRLMLGVQSPQKSVHRLSLERPLRTESHVMIGGGSWGVAVEFWELARDLNQRTLPLVFLRGKCVCLVRKTYWNQGSRQHRVDTSCGHSEWSCALDYMVRAMGSRGWHLDPIEWHRYFSCRTDYSSVWLRSAEDTCWIIHDPFTMNIDSSQPWILIRIAFCCPTAGSSRLWIEVSQPCTVGRLCREGPHVQLRPNDMWGQTDRVSCSCGRIFDMPNMERKTGRVWKESKCGTEAWKNNSVKILCLQPKLGRFVSFTHIRVQGCTPVLAQLDLASKSQERES